MDKAMGYVFFVKQFSALIDSVTCVPRTWPTFRTGIPKRLILLQLIRIAVAGGFSTIPLIPCRKYRGVGPRFFFACIILWAFGYRCSYLPRVLCDDSGRGFRGNRELLPCKSTATAGGFLGIPVRNGRK